MSIVDLLYPKHCPVCMDALPPGKTLICAPCRRKIAYTDGPVCYCCGRPLADETQEYCRNCAKSSPSFIRNFTWAEYGSFYTRRMLSEVKYHGDRQLLDFPCQDFAEKIKKEVQHLGIEVLLPVPVYRKRLLLRGYNQAEEIANRLGKALSIPVDRAYLIRLSETKAQKMLGQEARALNLFRAFQVSGSPGKYRTVMLVDDIYTTGATLNACTAVLKRSGTEKIYTATLAIGH